MIAESIFGVTKEIETGETRVALTPDSIKILTSDGHKVCIEKDAGAMSGFSNEAYIEAGAEIIETKEELWKRANVIVKVKNPTKAEYHLFRENQVIFSIMHLAVKGELVEKLLKKKVCSICAESIRTQDNEHPILRPMSEVAGRLAIQIGAEYLVKTKGGRGVLLGGVPGVKPGKVVILGAGVVGTNAAKVASGMGADVSVLDIDSKRLALLDLFFNGRVKTHYCNPTTILDEAKKADVLVTAVYMPDRKAPKLISEDVVKQMKKGSIIIDVSIDQGGNVATIDEETNIFNPVIERYGVLHCAISNLPALTPKTSSYAYSYAILPYIKEIAQKGCLNAIRNTETLSSGVGTFKGHVCNYDLAQTLGYEHTELSLLVGFKVE